MLTLVMMVQAVAGPPLTEPERRCTRAAGEQVVVCARRGENPHRLKPLPPQSIEPPHDPLAFGLPGGGDGRVYAFQRRINDVPSRGLAAKATFPLGRKRKPR